jgi:uncharacterized protein (TIGR00725 family)
MTSFPRMAVGVMGSAGGTIERRARKLMFKLGEEIGRRGYAIVTGAAPGLPHEAVLGAKSQGGLVVGISPALNFREHVEKYKAPTAGYDLIVYTGSGLMGREIENIRTCDVVVFAGGRSGTLGEFAIAYDEGKVIGVLTGTGGVSDHIADLLKIINKETGATLVSDDDPVKLIDALEHVYHDHVLPGYQDVLRDHNPDGVMQR